MKSAVDRQILDHIKEDLRMYFFQRRYQLALEGTVPVEEKVWMFATKVSTAVSILWRTGLKRTLDIVASFLGIIAGLPLFALVALAIKLDSKGPVVYRQSRVGMRGKVFDMFKFRTMRTDAEASTGPVWAREGDARITRIGRFLRKTHLDELPQLFNVLSGEMSLVGPRPERPYFVNELRKLIPHYDRRLIVKPGITGLAQVKRRYDETIADVRKKVKYDVLYVEKMCPFLDVKVLAATVATVVFGTGR